MIKLHPNLPALPIQPTAWRWLQDYGVELVVRDRNSTRGGGAWWPGRKLVELLTVQEEAAIHELAHAWWQERRLVGTTAAELMVACVKLSEETDPRYRRATELANHYVYGLRNQRDENSPTGWWMGMYVGLAPTGRFSPAWPAASWETCAYCRHTSGASTRDSSTSRRGSQANAF